MKSLVIKIAIAPDDPKVQELTPEVVAQALIDFGTAILMPDPALTVYPERFKSINGVLVTLGETNE